MPRWLKFGLLGCGGLSVLGVLLIVVLLVGIGVGGSAKQGSGAPESTSAEQKPKAKNNKADSENVELAIGEAAELRDRTFTVADAERNYFPPSRFSKIEPGNEYVRVYNILENTGEQQLSYNPLDFKVQDSSGVQKKYQPVSEIPNRLEFGELAPGGGAEDNLVFEIPQGDAAPQLLYETNAFSKRTVTVPL